MTVDGEPSGMCQQAFLPSRPCPDGTSTYSLLPLILITTHNIGHVKELINLEYVR